MKRRDVLVSSSILASLSAGCLRLSESEDDTSTATTNQSSPQDETATEGGITLSQNWTLERDIRLWNDVASTATGGNSLYFTTYSEEYNHNGYLEAVNTQNGTTEWEIEKPAEVIFELEYRDGKLYMLDSDGTLTVLDATEGTQNWEFPVPYNSRSDEDRPIWPGQISVSDDTVVVSLFDINSEDAPVYLYAIDKSSQNIDWEIDNNTILEYSEYSSVSPEGLSSIVDGTVFVGFSRVTMSVEVQDGTINWTENSVTAEGPISVSEDSIVMAGGSLQALDRSNGNSLWHVEENVSEGPSFISEPIITNGTVYATGRDTMVHAVDIEDGTESWTGQTGGTLRVGPVVTDSVVWAGSRDGRLYAFNRTSGSQLLSELIGNPVVGLEYLSGELLVFTSGRVFSFTAE